MSEETQQPKLGKLAERLMPLVEKMSASNDKEDASAREALIAALPGPTAEAVKPCQDIKVGKWLVGACRDRHFEWLAILKHPIERIQTGELIANVTGKPVWVADDLLWEKAKGQVAQSIAGKKPAKKERSEEHTSELQSLR